MIFVLIAGSYTPVCLLALDRKQGIPLLVLVWATAIIGIIIKIFFINCPHWVSSIIYIGMGWTCVLVFKPLLANLPASAFAWLLAGGIIYTVGGIIYGLKLPILISFQRTSAATRFSTCSLWVEASAISSLCMLI